MQWGEYLCRGTAPVALTPIKSSSDTDTNVVAAFDKLSSKLEQALKQLGLSNFSSSVAKQYLIGKLNDGLADRLTHVIGYIVDLLNKKKTKVCRTDGDTTQSGCPNVLPGLRAQPFWDTSEFPWIHQLESKCATIKEEFIALRKSHSTENSSESSSKDGGFQHYRSPKVSQDEQSDDLGALATSKGDWNVCYLYLHGIDFKDNQGLCPETISAINAIPRHYHHAMFSALAPDTHVKAHYGPTNKKLRCHLPIHIPRTSSDAAGNDDGASAGWIKVAGQTKYLQEGKAVIFDDSFLHEAGNTSSEEPRIVLIVDVWHPDLSDEEVHFLDFINKAQIKAAQRLSRLSKEQSCTDSNNSDSSEANNNGTGGESKSSGPVAEEEYGDFFQVIQKARSVGITDKDYAAIWGSL